MTTRLTWSDMICRGRGLLLFAILGLFLTGAPVGAARPAVSGGGHFVRVPAAAASGVARLRLDATLALDYGSFQWLQLNDADFARLSASGLPFSADPDAGTLQVREFVFDPVYAGEPTLPAALQTTDPGPALRLLQFVGPIQDAWLAALRTAGLTPLQYYPSNAFLVWGTAAQTQTLAAQPFVRWQGAFHPAYKLNADLAARRGRIANLDVMFYNDGQLEQTLAALGKLGAQVLQVYPAQPDRAFYNAIVTLDADALAAAAQLNVVLAVAYASPQPALDDEISDQIIAGNYTARVPFPGYRAWLDSLSLDGSGVIWASIDTGVDYDHPDFAGRIVGGFDFPGACQFPGQPGSDCIDGGHGTHVSGIIVGTGAGGFGNAQGFQYGLGVAPSAGVFAMNPLSGNAWPPLGGWQELSKRALLGGAVGGNNAWTSGEGVNHGYQATERTHDFIVLDGNFDTPTVAEPFIEVFSAGNAGYLAHTLTAPKEAKNIIVAASSANYFALNGIDEISSFSSHGPTADGRFGPTIAAPGESIASARNDLGGACSTAISGAQNLYAYCSGTSMAAAHTSGALALLTQWWRSSHAGANPSPALAKALLVNGAVEMRRDVIPWPIPNGEQGWGRIHLGNTLRPGVPVLYFDQETVLADSGAAWEITVGVPDPTKPLKITLAWSDAPGAVGASPALVNNLDLIVTDGPTIYRGNAFSNGWSISGNVADKRENLENVYLRSHGDTVVIRVEATNLPGDAILYNDDPTDQSFALICANCTLQPDFSLAASPAVQTVCAPASAAYSLAVRRALGFYDPVTLSVVDLPAGAAAIFGRNPVRPPATTTVIISNTAAVAPGAYPISLVGLTADRTHTTTVQLNLFDAPPAAPSLLTPAAGALAQPPRPTFTWNAPSQAQTAAIEIARDPEFASLVITATGLTGASFTPTADLPLRAVYYWRVRMANVCGSGAASAVYTFTTRSAPGDCAPGAEPTVLYSSDFEGGNVAGWTAETVTGDNRWTLSTAYPHSPVQAWHAADPISVSETRLLSPPLALPAGQNPLMLRFWNRQMLEPATAGCYDGGLLEITTDGGATWEQPPNEALLTHPYSGPIKADFGNPLAGRLAWCEDVWWYWQNIVDLSRYAGQTAQLRFVVGTDASVGRATGGWDIDDLSVQSCQPRVATFVFMPNRWRLISLSAP